MSKTRKKETSVLEVPVWFVVVMALTVLILVILLWSIKRRQNTHLHVADPGELGQMIQSIAGLSQGSIEEGNRIEVLQNGEFFTALFEEIERAELSIHLESYVWWTGAITRQVAEALAKKAREGVIVRVLVDASGSAKMEDEVAKIMEDGGVELVRFHPIRISNLGKLNNRDHRKVLIVDGRVGIVGGHGIAQEWTGNAEDKKHWRDTALRIEGPLVNHLQTVFSENWIEETGEVFAGDEYFPKLEPAGDIRAHVAFTSPSGSVSSVELLHLLAIASARRQVLIQNPYFLPDPADIEVFAEAVKRGVEVIVMMPSDDATDNALVQHASHHRFGALMEKGVRILEYDKTLLHQKVIIVDGIWSSVGSTNFDDRSFELNDEISVGVIDEGIASELIDAWNEDAKHTTEWSLDEWKKRSLWHRLVDFSTFLVNEQL